MTDHLLLIFAYHFPPENAIGGARPFRFAKYLSRLGYKYRVITAADQSGRDDPNAEYVPDPFLTRSRRDLTWQLERIARKVIFPGDEGVQWSYWAARAARKYIRIHPAKRVTILSTFPPLGAHFAGLQFFHNRHCAWIADFRDPICPDDPDERIASFRKRMNRWIERSVARRADAIIVNTDAALLPWQKKFSSFKNKFSVIWNGVDSEERITPLPIASAECRTVSHVGELYLGRDTSPFLESIARLIANQRFSRGSVRVRLVGPVENGCLPRREFIERARSEGWLELIPEQVPLQQARDVARTSNGLLLLQWGSATQVPGKLFEYLQIGRPILAFIQPNSPSERLLQQSGVLYRHVYPGTSPERIDAIVAEFFELPSVAVAPNQWFEEQFDAAGQAKTLDALIRSLHGERDHTEFPVRVAPLKPRPKASAAITRDRATS